MMCYNRFTAFYGGQHSGRKMNWLYHMSKGELVTNCFKNKYTLQVRSDLGPDYQLFIIFMCKLCRRQRSKCQCC